MSARFLSLRNHVQPPVTITDHSCQIPLGATHRLHSPAHAAIVEEIYDTCQLDSALTGQLGPGSRRFDKMEGVLRIAQEVATWKRGSGQIRSSDLTAWYVSLDSWQLEAGMPRLETKRMLEKVGFRHVKRDRTTLTCKIGVSRTKASNQGAGGVPASGIVILQMATILLSWFPSTFPVSNIASRCHPSRPSWQIRPGVLCLRTRTQRDCAIVDTSTDSAMPSNVCTASHRISQGIVEENVYDALQY
ncbi:hypothetical protein DOTSEDRAFT_39528 [Dothistroma septosporum NZE10]|uniref:Uncharacterized protein n=1 Tax=Dothistroma septosporum (strain NZE10 / CBS 128990) TaxID=675120 RepID=N1PDM8_DOTSN|nr:hypothetical protein DOTSEDRAFT_39528 [Dothistroma septosporum NZE10]